METLVCWTTHTWYPNKKGGKGEGSASQRTNKQDEDQTRPATHRPKLLRDIGHRGTMDTEGQRTQTKSDTLSYPKFTSTVINNKGTQP